MIGIVIVEDEAYIRKGMVLTTPWQEFGCEVIGEAKDGLEGYNLIKKLKPDIIITDVSMPVMDGIEMIRKLDDELEAEFIIISGFNDFNYAQQAIKLGVKDYLLKPIDDEDFYFTLKKVVKVIEERKEQIKQLERQVLIEEGKTELFYEESYDNNYDGRKRYVTKAVKWIEEHYQEGIAIGEVAEALEISESYLSRLFKKYTDYTFVEFLTDYRLKMAIQLLRDHTIKVYEVSEKVGYNDPKYFSILFKKKIGVTPMEFKNNLSGEQDNKQKDEYNE
ncbi:DNA-binding response regulator [Petrocella atlantisensis]|uniref:Stage 0 sporulation protein A homolog n=1 Tax=Petrocella atlantisensis TaxID=2173034 RepID=A0A3P7PG08_9FIRM|nr:response regulator [Petrocella atlantisensis]MCF8020700.1 response regulator [Vallitaleaceae bacterium]VDN47838.1 DNA-binding response regulator [Petrocella atlantisensis]